MFHGMDIAVALYFHLKSFVFVVKIDLKLAFLANRDATKIPCDIFSLPPLLQFLAMGTQSLHCAQMFFSKDGVSSSQLIEIFTHPCARGPQEILQMQLRVFN